MCRYKAIYRIYLYTVSIHIHCECICTPNTTSYIWSCVFIRVCMFMYIHIYIEREILIFWEVSFDFSSIYLPTYLFTYPHRWLSWGQKSTQRVSWANPRSWVCLREALHWAPCLTFSHTLLRGFGGGLAFPDGGHKTRRIKRQDSNPCRPQSLAFYRRAPQPNLPSLLETTVCSWKWVVLAIGLHET